MHCAFECGHDLRQNDSMLHLDTPPTMTRKRKKSDTTRERILAAAHRVFAEKGYNDARLSDIATAANTQAGAMYYYFDSKDALVEALMHRNVEHGQRTTSEKLRALPAAASYQERLLTVARASLASFVGEEDDKIVVYLRILNQVPAEIRKRMLTHAVDARHFAEDLIREGQAAGELRQDINPTIVSLMLMSNLIWCQEWFFLSPKHSLDELAEEMIKTLALGIQARDGS